MARFKEKKNFIMALFFLVKYVLAMPYIKCNDIFWDA